MSSTFTPSDRVDMTKERDWAANLGMLDWDDTSIVFTKRSLIEFLKYTGTTVDTNFSNISKLPRYAKFGKLSESSNAPVTKAQTEETTKTADGFIPSRRVRTAPGGPTTDIFGYEDEGDALSQAPSRGNIPQPAPATKPATEANPEEEHVGIDFGSSAIKPTRRVRENPGGNSSLANFWDAEETPEFKPTRRVREGPGGRDNINELF